MTLSKPLKRRGHKVSVGGGRTREGGWFGCVDGVGRDPRHPKTTRHFKPWNTQREGVGGQNLQGGLGYSSDAPSRPAQGGVGRRRGETGGGHEVDGGGWLLRVLNSNKTGTTHPSPAESQVLNTVQPSRGGMEDVQLPCQHSIQLFIEAFLNVGDQIIKVQV
eukprot:768457-Hanusia_phi.AAC.8